LVHAYIDALASKDMDAGITALTQASKQNIDMSIYASMLLSKIRSILLMRYSKTMADTFKQSLSELDFAFIQKHAEDPSSAINSKTLQVLLDAYLHIGSAYIPSIPLEIALFDLIQSGQK
jgi:DNA polymerase III gamma/tau subunit